MPTIESCRKNPTTPSRSSPPLLLLLLLIHQFAVVGGFEPLIQLPRSGPGSRPPGAFSVDDFGARGDGSNDDTKAFVDAWKAACSSPSGAVLRIPAGNVYLVRPVDFAGRCRSKLTLLVMGNIVAPSDPAIWSGLDPRKWLYFHGVNNLEVRGGGSINGMGQQWWEQSCKINASKPCRHAPTAITFHRCKQLTVQDLTLVNSQQMHLAFTRCFRVKASRLKLIAPAESPNTDGIHISASVSVVVEDSIIKTGDDCISIVSNSSDVLIKNITCGPGHGISLGKSNSWTQVHNVRVDGAFITDTENGVRIKTWQGGRGYARNIVFNNVVMDGVSNPIIIDQYYCDSLKLCPNQTSAVKVGEVSFVNIRGTSATEEVMKFACSDSVPCANIFLKDIQLSLLDSRNTSRRPTAYCWKALGFSSGLVYPPSCLLSTVDNLIIKQRVSSPNMLQF